MTAILPNPWMGIGNVPFSISDEPEDRFEFDAAEFARQLSIQIEFENLAIEFARAA